jgi:hypothetical protein
MNAPTLATWLLHQFRPGDTALAGDLLEEAARGRSGGWYWRQVLTAIVTGTIRDCRKYPLVTLRALATGWVVLLLMFVLFGDLVAEGIADIFWGWKRHIGYSDSYWWPFYVSATIVSYGGFAVSTLAMVRLHRRHAMSLVMAYAWSVVLVLIMSAAFLDWLARPIAAPHWLFFLVSVSLPYTWRSGLIAAPLVIVLSGLIAMHGFNRSTAAHRLKENSSR